MLEGQVAVLSWAYWMQKRRRTGNCSLIRRCTGRTTTPSCCTPSSPSNFLSKGQVDVQRSALLQRLVEADNRQLVVKDHAGVVRLPRTWSTAAG